MPTGYTADVKDGKVTAFPVFAMQCARAFGALITMRDDSHDAPIPDEFKPDTYHRDAMAKARKELREVSAITAAVAERRAKADHDAAMKSWTESVKRDADTKARYVAMLAEVRAWTPPTLSHQGLKVFMVEQLVDSIKFDCDHDQERWKPKPLTGAEWKLQQVERAAKDVTYHEQQWQDEQKRAAERTEWVQQLRDSLAAVNS